MAVLVQAVLGFLWVPVAGHLSDRIGRKRMYIIGCVFSRDLWLHLLWAARHEGAESDVYRHRAVVASDDDVLWSPGGDDRRKLFTPRLRYSGASLGYQLASIIAGGPSPFIATALFATFNSSFPIALYILLCGILGIVATSLLTDYTNKDISEEYDRFPPPRAAAN